MAPQTPAPTRAAWFLVIPVQPVRKKPSAANASCLFFFISASQQGLPKFLAKVVQGVPHVKENFYLYSSLEFSPSNTNLSLQRLVLAS
jgi:hypothetical protein